MDSPMPSMPNLNPQMPQQPVQGSGSSHTGIIIAIIAVVALLAAGGAYYWMFMRGTELVPEPTPSQQVTNQEQPAADATSVIDADLGATEDLDIDAEFQDIDADLKTL